MISEAQVYANILELLRLFPALRKSLPEGCERRAFWRRLLTRNAETRRLLEVLRELPGFNERAPRRRTAAAWKAVFEEGPQNVLENILRDIIRRGTRKPVKRRPVRRWRDAFGPNEKLQRVRPVESQAWLPNPHRGTTTFQRFQGDPLYAGWTWSDTHGPLSFPPLEGPVPENRKYVPRTTLSYCRWPWAWLEPRKGRYRWDIIDGALRAARERGQTLQARFEPYTARVNYSETPCRAKRHPRERSVNMPDWFWDTGARWIRKGPYAANEPDCNDPRYIRHFSDFVRAFARRYDGHPDLESVDLAYAGFWGESGGNSTPATAAKLADVYLKSFRQTQVVTMLGTPGCRHAAKRTNGTRRQVGWRADCFGDLRNPDHPDVPRGLCWNHTFDSYPKSIAKCGLQEAWRTAPVTMETCWNVTGWYLDGYDFDVIEREGMRYHMSVFMPKADFFPAAVRARMEAFDKKIGYRFALRQMQLPLESRRGETILLQFFIDNVGCAPLYRPYRLALRFRQGGRSAVVPLRQDIRGWMPGHTWFEEKIAVPRALRRGEAKVDLAIIGDNGQPRVWFAIGGRTDDGWHPLTSVDVVS
jgi:hypothetical protein